MLEINLHYNNSLGDDTHENVRPGRIQEVNEGDKISLDCLLPNDILVPGVRVSTALFNTTDI